MIDLFIRKLGHGVRLQDDDIVILKNLSEPVRHFEPRQDILAERIQPRQLPLIVEGWACRYRLLENGRRQIISLLLPGDLCEPFGILPCFMDTGVGALTPVSAIMVPAEDLQRAARTSGRINEAFWWDLLVSSAIEREHIVSLGRRSAVERLGHLLLEIHFRLSMVGLADGAECDLPLSQSDLGDVLGLSAVHLNRSLQELRQAGVLSLTARRLIIENFEGLRHLSYFDSAYLHGSDNSFP